MAVVVFTSGPGAPGVTTTALALALAWPRHVLLADADRDPSQVILAGHLRGMDSGGLGLASVLQAHRERRPLDDELWLHTLPLTDDTDPERRFLAGFAQPGSVRLFETVWSGLGEAFQALHPRGIDVLVDAGRIGVRGLPAGLLASADLVVAITRSNLRSLAALRLHLPTLREQLSTMPVRVPLALGIVGAGMPYGADEIARQFGVEVLVEAPFDARSAGALIDGEPFPRQFLPGFMDSLRASSKHLAEHVHELRNEKEALSV